MKILITGADGQLGYDVMRKLETIEHTVLGMTRDKMDITKSEQINDVFQSFKPDIVIHCAAYTMVDMAEDEPEECYAVNVFGTKNIVDACKDTGAKLVYISTDYVFPGTGNEPYRVNDAKGPLNIYGKSKLEGEILVQQNLNDFYIIRISWVFGIHGTNFVSTMLRLGEIHDTLKIVGDQIGSPTYTIDVANVIAKLIDTKQFGIYHVTNDGYCSWAEFAEEIFRRAKLPVNIIAIPSSEYPTRAKRPLNSRLSKKELSEAQINILPTWENALERFLCELRPM